MKESIHKLTVFKIGTPCLSIIIAKNIVPKNPMGFPKTSCAQNHAALYVDPYEISMVIVMAITRAILRKFPTTRAKRE